LIAYIWTPWINICGASTSRTLRNNEADAAKDRQRPDPYKALDVGQSVDYANFDARSEWPRRGVDRRVADRQDEHPGAAGCTCVSRQRD
jgi:hypothetical protein